MSPKGSDINFPNKYGFWYLLGLLLAYALNGIPIFGVFIGFFITSMALTAIFHNKMDRNFRKYQITDIALTCSLIIFLVGLLFFVFFIPNFKVNVAYILIINAILIFLGVSLGILSYNKIMKIK